MKKLCLAVLFAAMFAGLAWSADVDQAQSWLISPRESGSYCVYRLVVTDSNAFYPTAIDTSEYVSMLPWGSTLEYPDAITLYGVFTEIGTNGATVGDCVMVAVDVNVTNALKAATTWAPISGTTGSKTYASRTGKVDTLADGITAGGSGAMVYSFTAAQLATNMPYMRIRWACADALAAATDSMDVTWYVIFSKDPDN